ncbi:MAG TPA: type II secretion system protein [Nevskiaceae bacterium]|nr:type II secretion system protein [Nevskiaceae bacterium]
MKGGSRGFTITEVLIVLAVTGALFISAALLIAGRQNKAQFDQGIRQVQSKIQQTISDIGTGFYPNTNNFTCTAFTTGPSLTSGATAQGANGGCIFVGKAMQFGVQTPSGAATDPEQFNTYTIAGLQKDTTTGKDVTTLAEAKVTLVAKGATNSVPDAFASDRLEGGLTVHSMVYKNGAVSRPISAVAFVSSLASYGSTGAIASGSQQVGLVPINLDVGVSDFKKPKEVMVDTINTVLDDPAKSPVNPAGSVQICFTSGGTLQSGLITIGGNNRQLSVTLSIKDNTTCS